jgi:hypothetical protein
VIAKRVADGDDKLPDAQVCRTSERGMLQIAARDPKYRKIGFRIVANNPSLDRAATGERHRNTSATAEDVAVGENEAVRRVDYTRPQA